MCCKCGGGDQCRDSNGNLKDKLNNDCDYYDANPTKCGINDSATFTASEMCCACFYGTIRPTTAA